MVRSKSYRYPSITVVLMVAAVLFAACSNDDPNEGSTADTATPTSLSITTPDDGSGFGDPHGTDPLPPLPADVALPIVFVHGFAGSAQQYESQAMRFIANGYPQERIVAYDHDGAGLAIDEYVEDLADLVDDMLGRFDVDQVYLVGHSRGTRVSSDYLSDPERAATIAKYISLDGQPCPDVEVACLTVTQKDLPGQAHVEVATSPESFVQQYEFLFGQEPQVVDIVAQRAPVEISGRAVVFPANTGRDGATLTIWAVDPDTGARVDGQPVFEVELGDDGVFGPVRLVTGAHYEYALSSPDSEVTHHLYLQPYLRSSNLVRLLSSDADGPTRVNTNTGPDHVSLLAIRMREWYGDGDAKDVLEISVDGGEPVDAITDFVHNANIGLHIHDDTATPGRTTFGPLLYFAEQPFQSGIDIFIPSSSEGSGTVRITNLPRGDADRPQVLNVPRWPSDAHAISLVFSDWPVDGA